MSRGVVGLTVALARVTLRRPFSRRSPRRWWVLLAGLVLIPVWQLGFARSPARNGSRYHNGAAVGLQHQEGLVYLYHYLGLYPVAPSSPVQEQDYSEAAAQRIVAERGSTLVMEPGNPLFGALRIGDHARIWLYLPGAWLEGAPRHLTIMPANAAAFIAALLAVFASFWWSGRPILGSLVVALSGSNPFQIYEVYSNQNVFGWPITMALIALALWLPVVDARGPRGRWAFVLAVCLGLLLGTVRHIRSESIAILISVVAMTAFLPLTNRLRRAALGATLVGATLAGSLVWDGYFRHKITHATEIVTRAGGYPHPLAADPELHHNVWMTIWEGLSDFDRTHGYKWDDSRAHAYAVNQLVAKYGMTVPPWDGGLVFRTTFHDAKRRYPVLPFELPHYTEVIRAKVLSDITADPLWYLGILGQRLWRIASETTPVHLRLNADLAVRFPLAVAQFVVLAVALALSRSRLLLQLLLFSLPLSLPSLLVFSGQGMPNQSVFHLFAVATLLGVVIEGSRYWGRRAMRQRRVW